MRVLDELEHRVRRNVGYGHPDIDTATILALVEVVRAATEMRKAGIAGVWSGGKSQPTEEASAFDAAMAKLEGIKP